MVRDITLIGRKVSDLNLKTLTQVRGSAIFGLGDYQKPKLIRIRTKFHLSPELPYLSVGRSKIDWQALLLSPNSLYCKRGLDFF